MIATRGRRGAPSFFHDAVCGKIELEIEPEESAGAFTAP